MKLLSVFLVVALLCVDFIFSNQDADGSIGEFIVYVLLHFCNFSQD